MPNYLISIRQPSGYKMNEDNAEPWQKWFAELGPAVVDPGNPIFSRETLGHSGDGTSLGGYTLITADSLDQAVDAARSCPILANGGGVEVGEITPIM
jgi:hypothetical protein